jgi:hypothetical protein
MFGGLHDPLADVARKHGADSFIIADAETHG